MPSLSIDLTSEHPVTTKAVQVAQMFLERGKVVEAYEGPIPTVGLTMKQVDWLLRLTTGTTAAGQACSLGCGMFPYDGQNNRVVFYGVKTGMFTLSVRRNGSGVLEYRSQEIVERTAAQWGR